MFVCSYISIAKGHHNFFSILDQGGRVKQVYALGQKYSFFFPLPPESLFSILAYEVVTEDRYLTV